MELLCKRAGYASRSAHQPKEALSLLEKTTVDLVLLDMNFSIETSGKQGLRLLQQILDTRPKLPVILMTGWATVQLAVEGMKIGAKDFVAKPWDNRNLLASIKTLLDLQPSKVDPKTDEEPFAQIITQSKAMERVLEVAKRVAPTEASVLITGESGTGKELVAEAIHGASKRAAGPLVAVNLGGVPESLFESELFGHKAGAFTDARTDRKGRIELAEGGSIFLDEVGDLALPNQVKLLRVLQERRYERLGESYSRSMDIRVISATSRKLREMVVQGEFREDLLYRINLIHLHLPPLRERAGDIELLAQHFLRSATERHSRSKLVFSTEALKWLRQQAFPGNIRQLQNLIERVTILSTSDTIDLAALQQHGYFAVPNHQMTGTAGKTLAEVEERMIRTALERNQHSITATAKELGLTRAALYRRLDKFQIRYAD